FIQQGHDQGYNDGIKSGVAEGYLLGLEKGYEVASEVGFYNGCVESWSKLIQMVPEEFNERTIKQIQSLRSMIASFPLTNNPNTSIFETLEKMRAKYKLINSLLKVDSKSGEGSGKKNETSKVLSF
ncbi:hypothetical protein BKA69DRAFT_1032123, partial [Paraphysoderma sedebokerense]